ncbi:class IIb bacteriocin, lactobin A/cerein 7B family, partial [Pseudomonas aeruginosa]
MKTKEKLTASKEVAENVSRKFRELTEEELEQVSGGIG